MMVSAAAPGSFRGALKRIAAVRSLYHFGQTLADLATARPSRVAADCEFAYRDARDPWSYASDEQQARFRCALEMIDAAFGRRSDLQVLEIGCGEGAFTELLAPRCSRMIAADASPTALGRAQTRLGARANIVFRHFDVLRDPPGSGFDLIVMDHVIDLFGRRTAYRLIADRIAAALKPDGVALIGVMRAFELAEQARWSRWVLRGGVAILDWVGHHTDLVPVTTVTRSFYTYTLFRRQV
jgi:cyclopropane fatty-acyl-phospholipid synthase-like methyltransferase